MTTFTPPDQAEIQHIIRNALAEDIGKGDITSEIMIPEKAEAELHFVAREEMVVCGSFIPESVYRELGDGFTVTRHIKEGQKVQKGTCLVSIEGNARILLTGERVALNLMQRMSGVATLTNRFVEAIRNSKAKILDTRKTMPGLRALDKYAVRVGGGHNHRMRLDDMVLVKDNHIAICGDIKAALEIVRNNLRLKNKPEIKIIVECDTLDQVREALTSMPDRLLLDNMSTRELIEAVQIVAGRIPLEASGGVNINTVSAISQTGIDYISVGAITHSAVAADIGADTNIKSN